jgi:hypothetical protein
MTLIEGFSGSVTMKRACPTWRRDSVRSADRILNWSRIRRSLRDPGWPEKLNDWSKTRDRKRKKKRRSPRSLRLEAPPSHVIDRSRNDAVDDVRSISSVGEIPRDLVATYKCESLAFVPAWMCHARLYSMMVALRCAIAR